MVRVKVVTVNHEVICAGWGEPGGEWTEWGRRREMIPQVMWCISETEVGDL